MQEPRTTQQECSCIPPVDQILIPENNAYPLLGVSKPTFRSWVAAGLIRPVALPGGVRRNLYRRADLEAFADRLARGDVA
jgi:hypothetical protein